MRIWLIVGVICIFSHMVLYAQDDVSEDDGAMEEYSAEDGNDYLLQNDTIDTSHTLLPPEELGTTKSYQKNPIDLRRFDDKKWKEIVGKTDFNERKKKPEKEDEKKEGHAPDLSLPWSGPLLRVISYLVITAIIIVLVYFLVRNISFGLKIERTKLESDDLGKPVEDIENLDIQTLLDRASKEGNFRLAVRLHYLALLQKLNELGVISWKKDKTNRDYLTELFSRDFFFDDIRRLTVSYESVWYGEHELKPESFQDISARFQTVYQNLNMGETK